MARPKNLRLRLSAGALLPLIVAVAAQAAYTLVSHDALVFTQDGLKALGEVFAS